MVVILYRPDCWKIAEEAAADMVKAFTNHVKVALLPAGPSSSWPGDISWDDLLVVMFDDKAFPDEGNTFIKKYLEQRPHSATLLAVTVRYLFLIERPMELR